MNRWNRTVPLVALALAATTTLIGPASPAGAAETATATFSEVTCVDNDGEVTATLAASDTDPATFLVLIDGQGGEEVSLTAGETVEVPTTAIEDGDHTFEAILMTEAGEEVGETLAFADRVVACDAAPVGPYSNPRGEVMDGCEGTGWVTASNKPIGGNVADLQPVTFRVTFLPSDEPVEEPGDPGGDTGGGEDPGDGGDPTGGERSLADGPERELASFVLDATTPTYERIFSADELGGWGTMFLRVGDEVVASAQVGLCYVLAIADGEGGGPEVVNTGA